MNPAFDRIRGPGTELAALAHALGATVAGACHVRVFGVRHDSRQVEPGDLFVARSGQHTSGLAHVQEALERGAGAVMMHTDDPSMNLPVPVLRVCDPMEALAKAAALVYGDPSGHVPVVGITGTNGKTTTAALLRCVLQDQGHRPAVLGTLGAQFGTHGVEMRHNTPEADELTRWLAWLREQGASDLVMEVTSHALAQKRVDGVHFRVGAFTNLTHDHLDLHPGFEAYGRAKARLFEVLHPAVSVLMIDDAFGAQLADRCPGDVLRVSRRPDPRADVCPLPEAVYERAIACRVRTPVGVLELRSRALFGEHNVANLLLALGIALGLGLDGDAAAASLSEAPSPPGRLERCDAAEDDVIVLVDYAHTPDGLEKALTAVRPWATGRVICVFGCGGDRDRSKRAVMGRVAARLADLAIVTSDNPRSEPPSSIADAILLGTRGGRAEVRRELDRARAIDWAVQAAGPGDVVLIAGKGHETTQTAGGRTWALDDRVCARQALAHRRRNV